MPPEERKLFEERYLAVFNFGVLPFYWASYERSPGRTNWRENSEVARWCLRNGIVTKGHPLVWTHPAGIPKWLTKFPGDLHEDLLKARVINTVSGFAGEIDMWDVVNEFVHTPTWADKERRGSVETAASRADYVEKALRWARLANPKARLILNEFQMIPALKETASGSLPPRERFIAVVGELDKRGAPRFEVGIQAHEPRDEWFAPEDVWAACDAFQKLGRRVHMTEFIPQSSGKAITGRWRTGTWNEEAQADFAEQFLRLNFGHPAVVSVNFWGFSDANIWLPGGGLVDKEYRPKPIYERVRRLIREEWMTRNLSLQTDEGGRVKFRGFYGAYQVRVSAPGLPETVFDLNLAKDGPSAFHFRFDRKP